MRFDFKIGKNSMILIYTVSIFAIFLWGISYIWTDSLLDLGIPIFYFVFIRMLVAGIVLFLLNATSGKIQKVDKKDWPKFFALAFCEPFVYFLCETYGIEFTGSPTISAMIIATVPIFSIFAGRILFKERIRKTNFFGMILSLLGILLVVMSQGDTSDRMTLGIILLIIAVISEVGHASFTKSLSGNYTAQTITMYQFLIGSIYLFPLFLYKGLDNFEASFYFSAEVMYPIVCLAVLCSSLAFSLWVGSIKSLGVAKSGIFIALIPVVTALVSWLLGDNALTLHQGIGIAIAVVGLIISQANKRKDIKNPEQQHVPCDER
jgi:drug/metabolite transporter (DMT)-like permease